MEHAAERERLPYLDNLRALAMVAGVLFHAGLAYSPLMHDYWLTADRARSEWVDAAAWFAHLFRMPLFFAIAGFFAARLVERRGVGGMLKNRTGRVLLPLVVFWPVVTAAMGGVAAWAAGSVRHAGPVLEMVRRREGPWLAPSLAHLWFLGYLMLFYLLIWIAATAEWRAPAGWGRAATPGRLLGLAPLGLAPALASVSAPTPAPEGVLPQLWAVVFYGAFFFFGYAVYGRAGLGGRNDGWQVGLGLGSLAAYGGFLWAIGQRGTGAHALAAVLEAYISVWMTVWCLAAGRAWLNTRVGWLRYLADGSYWTYLAHLPVVFALQAALLDWEAGWVAKWAVTVAGTLGVCLASYQVGVRGTVVGRMLNGAGRRGA